MKLAPVLRALERRPDRFAIEVVHTGQHYDPEMSDVFFEQLGIRRPDVCLDVGSGGHGVQTGRILAALEEHLVAARVRPSGVVVFGDVNSTMAGALAAVKLGIPVAHVEAGLRSFDRSMPEEINRTVTDAIADVLLVSEPSGETNLRREGVSPDRIRFVGNVMIDTLVAELPAARALGMPERVGTRERAYALVTLHRPSNVDVPRRLGELAAFLERLADRLTVVFPVHPRTRERLRQFGLYERLAGADGVILSAPLGYRENLGLMVEARLVITDSGGIQEETSHLGVPCLTFRKNTERPVTVTDGTNTVIGDDLAFAEETIMMILEDRYKRGRPIAGWDGHAAERVADALAEVWSKRVPE
jgi:UDP-N-acetylglucosamine 2-epimerase (non-hydrolysing)